MRMLSSKDWFDKSRGFGKCAAKLDVVFYEHSSSKALRVVIVAWVIMYTTEYIPVLRPTVCIISSPIYEELNANDRS